ncbi:UL9-like protein [Gallid alphaherpesvirus 3]|uniref:Replication origin-binding protein n=1 Tax=Gallid alphaherpesvirus 3 TaxID=35250 RepID=F8TBZ9_9ALPH|nr:UL9-like protein [Gallid alphaherpesvirus 3]AEI00210.1 UL9-like protein [Gallid alphaherpesvirus 3]QEY02221.1 UL9-like protein [Gallid alphaherpesvirus 3]
MIDYVCSASLSRILYGEGLIDWIAKNRPGVTTERQSDGPVTFPPPLSSRARNVLVVRAPMGSGKTTALIDWLQRILYNPDTSVLVVSCRRSFTNTLFDKLSNAGLSGFGNYLTASDYSIRGREFYRLLIQIESLHRIDPDLLGRYEIIILDEVMSTISQLYSPTMRHLSRVDSILTTLLRNCPRIIAMDATINTQLVDMLASMRGEDNIHVIVGEYAAPGFSKRSCTILRNLGTDTLLSVMNSDQSDCFHVRPTPKHGADGTHSRHRSVTETTFFSELSRRLAGGLNICLFSSTISFSEAAARFCLIFTDSVLVLNSTRDIPIDINSWTRYRVVIYTTVVTVGLSFISSHFHSMFAYIKPTRNGPDMVSVYQSLGRIRSLRRNEVLVYIDASGARSEPVFTPMLLNHVIASGGGWPAQFVCATNMLCNNFRRDCVPTFKSADALYIFPRFKYKHLFERCTLNNLSDSINILHALLDANLISVRFDGSDSQLDAETFCAFLADLTADALIAQRDLKHLRKIACGQIQADLIDNEMVEPFIHKYLRHDGSPSDLAQLLTKLAEPLTREQFINITMLEACRATPAALYSEEVFCRIYQYYASGSLPIIGPDGGLGTVAITADFNVSGRWHLYRLCCRWATSLGINPLEGTAKNLDPLSMLRVMQNEYDTFIRSVLEVTRCYLLDARTASKRSVKTTKSALSGLARYPLGRQTEENHAFSVFKVTWEILYGLRLVKSATTFPGGTKVKNLRKAEIEALLDGAGIDRTSIKTHRALYTLLMKNKASFRKTRYEIRRPKWYALVKSRLDAELGIYHDILDLETVLAEVPPACWPRVEGAIDFHSL